MNADLFRTDLEAKPATLRTLGRGSTIVAVGADVPGATATVRFRHDEDLGVRLLTESLIAELVAAAWWVRRRQRPQ
jgi:hypothetical protein